MNRPSFIECDVIIAGGGLAGCLIALVLKGKRPELDVWIVEPGDRLGGNHVWSFFDSDIAPEHRWLVEPLICHRWQGYDVAFPKRRRTLDAVYNSIESERLDEVVRGKIAADRIVRASIVSMEPNRPQTGETERHLWHYYVELDNGQTFKATQVIDARGPGDISTLDLGYQKFVGIEVKVPGGHGLTRPVVMDATVEQLDGYRFVYCLPFDAETVFIEDTYYSDTADLDVPAIRERIIAYARAKGWQTNGGGREETGVLPVVIGGDFETYWQSTGENVAKAGLRSGRFHAQTGYSLPDAVRTAIAMPEALKKEGIFFANQSHRGAKSHWRAQGYYRLLGKMLFRAAEPDQRYRIFERFYGLSDGLIERFYAGKSTWYDKLRIVSGKPPVPIWRAIKAILDIK